MNESTTSKSNGIKEYQCTYIEINEKSIKNNGKLCVGTIAISFINYESTQPSLFRRMFKNSYNTKEIVLLYLPMEEISYLEKINENGIRCKTIHGQEYIFENFDENMETSNHSHESTIHIRNKILQLLCDRLKSHLSKSLSFNTTKNNEKNEEQRLILQNNLKRSISLPVETTDMERQRAILALNALADFSGLSLSLRDSSDRSLDAVEEDKENNVIGSIVTVTSSPTLLKSNSMPLPSTVTAKNLDKLEQLWETKKSCIEIDYNNHVIQNAEISQVSNLDSFYKDYLSNGAKFSFQKYLESKGDMDVEVTPWETSHENNLRKSRRTIHYQHPVNVPMAPPSAKATKEQTLHIFGEYGICIETKTKVDDVPLTDCFHVSDIIFIEARGEKLTMNASFQINFTKSTIWKHIIQLNTNNAFKQFLTGYNNMIQENDDVDATNRTQTTYSCNTTTSDIDSTSSYEMKRGRKRRIGSDRLFIIVLFVLLSILLVGMQLIFFFYIKEEMQVMKSNHELNVMDMVQRQMKLIMENNVSSKQMGLVDSEL